jgi:hypothetical protein
MNAQWMVSSARSCCLIAIVFGVVAPGARAQSDDIVISQVYGGGNTTGSAFNRDFIELFNRGTQAVSLDGWSVQYQQTASFLWLDGLELPAVSIPPGGYFLIGIGNAGAGAPLPAVDAADSGFAMAAATGRIALVQAPSLADGLCSDPVIVDLVQYGGTASTCCETAPTPALSATTAAHRRSAGCEDSNSNHADFEVAAPSPRNSSAAAHTCGTQPTCAPDVVPNNAVDVGDLLAVITGWGECPALPAPCPANIVNAGTSAAHVDADDMLAVITNWGPCP